MLHCAPKTHSSSSIHPPISSSSFPAMHFHTRAECMIFAGMLDFDPQTEWQRRRRRSSKTARKKERKKPKRNKHSLRGLLLVLHKKRAWESECIEFPEKENAVKTARAPKLAEIWHVMTLPFFLVHSFLRARFNSQSWILSTFKFRSLVFSPSSIVFRIRMNSEHRKAICTHKHKSNSNLYHVAFIELFQSSASSLIPLSPNHYTISRLSLWLLSIFLAWVAIDRIVAPSPNWPTAWPALRIHRPIWQLIDTRVGFVWSDIRNDEYDWTRVGKWRKGRSSERGSCATALTMQKKEPVAGPVRKGTII